MPVFTFVVLATLLFYVEVRLFGGREVALDTNYEGVCDVFSGRMNIKSGGGLRVTVTVIFGRK